MKITIYELLGLVKDGKAPKKIKIRNEIYEYKYIGDGFIDYAGIEKETSAIFFLSSYIGNNYISDIFTDEVEIIEEDKKIEKISWSEKESLAGDFTTSKKQEILARRTEKLKASLNELIDEINKLKEGK